MLPRSLRLSRASFSRGRGLAKLASPSFSLSFGPALHGGCAAIVGKTVARRSPDRHLLKRRMLTLMRPWCREDHALVVQARGKAATLAYRALSVELLSLLNRLPKA